MSGRCLLPPASSRASAWLPPPNRGPIRGLSAVEDELLRGQHGPEQVLQRLAPRRLTVLRRLFQQAGESLRLRQRRLATQRQQEDAPDGLLVAHLLGEPFLDVRLLVAQLLVECLAVVQVQRLANARFLLPFT